MVFAWRSGGEEESKVLHKKLDEKMDSYATGELEHAAEVVSSIWELSRKGVTARETVPINPGVILSQEAWEMRILLIRLIQGGRLLHRKYWVRQSGGGSVCPIYFPSIVSSSALSQVATCE